MTSSSMSVGNAPTINMPTGNNKLPEPVDCLYQSCYCEENIWHLCQHPACQDGTVIFIASPGGLFPMLGQQAMSDPTTPIFWDYHVILLLAGNPARIVDFDTTLPFCSDLHTYFSQSFLPEAMLAAAYIPSFKLIAAADYSRNLRSDRRHMRTADGWSATPPEWPPIGGGGSNLAAFIDRRDQTMGKILSYQDMLTRFT